MRHGGRQCDGELLEKICVRFRYRHSRTEARHNRIVTHDDSFKLGTVQQISLLHGDAVLERLESLRRANKCRYGVTLFNRLANDFQAGAPGGTQHQQLHAAVRATGQRAYGFRIELHSHISYRCLY